jgi:guanylate kinase
VELVREQEHRQAHVALGVARVQNSGGAKAASDSSGHYRADGTVDEEWLDAALLKALASFRAADVSASGWITRLDHRKLYQKQGINMGDARVAEYIRSQFDTCDLNGDNRLSLCEYLAAAHLATGRRRLLGLRSAAVSENEKLSLMEDGEQARAAIRMQCMYRSCDGRQRGARQAAAAASAVAVAVAVKEEAVTLGEAHGQLLLEADVEVCLDQAASCRPIVVAGPSGVGKGTLIGMLVQAHPGQFGFSVSHTTRAPRAGEVGGRDYHFTTREAMRARIEAGDFIEWAEVYGNYYGTSKQAVSDVQAAGTHCILDIDVQGVRSVKQTDLDAVFLFVQPPSMDCLEERLRGRATDSDESIERRMKAAVAELEYGTKSNFDAVLVNDDLQAAFSALQASLRTLVPSLCNVQDDTQVKVLALTTRPLLADRGRGGGAVVAVAAAGELPRHTAVGGQETRRSSEQATAVAADSPALVLHEGTVAGTTTAVAAEQHARIAAVAAASGCVPGVDGPANVPVAIELELAPPQVQVEVRVDQGRCESEAGARAPDAGDTAAEAEIPTTTSPAPAPALAVAEAKHSGTLPSPCPPPVVVLDVEVDVDFDLGTDSDGEEDEED